MKKSRKLTTYALGSALMLAASAQAVTYDFTAGEGFVDGNLTNQVNGWMGDGSYTIDTTGGGSLNLVDETNQAWKTAFPSNALDAVTYNTFSVSNVVTWSQAITNGDNALFSVMLNEVADGGTPVRLSLDKRNNNPDEYVIQLKSDDNSGYGWKQRNESMFGLDQLVDPDSDEIAFGFTLTKGTTTNDWSYSFVLRNLTTDSEIWASSGDMSVSSNFNAATTLYAGITSGVAVEQNGATNRQVKSFSFTQSYVEPPEPPSPSIVQWGLATDIVTNSLSVVGESSTYASGVIAIPISLVSPTYYPNNVGKSPEFNYAGYDEDGGVAFLGINNNGSGDRINTSDNAAQHECMVVWENFLTDGSELKTVSIEIQGYGNVAAWSNGNYRILIQKGSGVWYASEATEVVHNVFSSEGAQDAASMTWYAYTPHSGGYPVIASTSSAIDMTDVVSVGYYVQVLNAGTAYIGARVQAFNATATPGPTSSTVLQWGESGGDTNIVDSAVVGVNGFVNFQSEPKQFNDGVEISPLAVDGTTKYYEFSTDRSPVFNGALSGGSSGAGSVRNSTGGDYLQITDNVATQEAMIVWESFLETPTKVTGISTEIYGHGTSNGVSELRFIVKQDGAWYASAAQTFNKSTYNGIQIDTDAVDWFDFTPLSSESGDSSGVIGSPAAVSLTNVVSIGYHVYTVMDGVVWNGTRIRYFRVAGLVDTSLSGFAAFVDDYGLSGTPTDNNDGDELNDWAEYIFGGNPTNAADIGTQPSFDAAAGDYAFSLIGDSSLSYYVLTNLNLVSGSWGTNSGPVSVPVNDGVMGDYTDPVGSGNSELFIQLLVE